MNSYPEVFALRTHHFPQNDKPSSQNDKPSLQNDKPLLLHPSQLCQYHPLMSGCAERYPLVINELLTLSKIIYFHSKHLCFEPFYLRQSQQVNKWHNSRFLLLDNSSIRGQRAMRTLKAIFVEVRDLYSDHLWPGVTTSDHVWPNATSFDQVLKKQYHLQGKNDWPYHGRRSIRWVSHLVSCLRSPGMWWKGASVIWYFSWQ